MHDPVRNGAIEAEMWPPCPVAALTIDGL